MSKLLCCLEPGIEGGVLLSGGGEGGGVGKQLKLEKLGVTVRGDGTIHTRKSFFFKEIRMISLKDLVGKYFSSK